jgi:hypothetical protein
VLIDQVEANAEAPAGCRLKSPVAGRREHGFAITLRGSVPGAAVQAVDVIAEGTSHVRMPVDVAAAGEFRAVIGTLDLAQCFELVLEAVREDASRVPLWTVRGRRPRSSTLARRRFAH